jgi:hypothetical protein
MHLPNYNKYLDTYSIYFFYIITILKSTPWITVRKKSVRGPPVGDPCFITTPISNKLFSESQQKKIQ